MPACAAGRRQPLARGCSRQQLDRVPLQHQLTHSAGSPSTAGGLLPDSAAAYGCTAHQIPSRAALAPSAAPLRQRSRCGAAASAPAGTRCCSSAPTGSQRTPAACAACCAALAACRRLRRPSAADGMRWGDVGGSSCSISPWRLGGSGCGLHACGRVCIGRDRRQSRVCCVVAAAELL